MAPLFRASRARLELEETKMEYTPRKLAGLQIAGWAAGGSIARPGWMPRPKAMQCIRRLGRSFLAPRHAIGINQDYNPA